MQQPNSSVITSSDATFGGAVSQAGFLTDGTLSIGGNLVLNNGGTTVPFAQGANATLLMYGAGSHLLLVGGNITQPIQLGSFAVGPNNSLSVNSGAFSVGGTFANQGSLTLSSFAGFTVAGATIFGQASSTDITGAMTLNGSSFFSSNANVVGQGSLTLLSGANCTKQSTATVNVTGTTPPFTASAQQCANQIP
jgi:hypothetical protein